MELEPGMVDQVADLVHGWDVEVLDAITGHILPGEADLLARVFAAHGGLAAGLRVMTSYMVKAMEDSSDRADWALDAAVVRAQGWFDDEGAWSAAAAVWAGDVAPHALMIELADEGDALMEPGV